MADTPDEERRKKRREYQRRYREANRDAVNERKRRDYAANQEKVQEAGRVYYAANREQINANSRARRAADPEKFREAERRRNEANRNKRLEQDRAWRSANRDKINARQRELRAADPAKARQLQKLRRHRMTEEEWSAMWRQQDGCCYLCGTELREDRSTTIDHDHSCCPAGRSCSACRRGLACVNCNAIVGMAGEDPQRLRVIADALEKMLLVRRGERTAALRPQKPSRRHRAPKFTDEELEFFFGVKRSA